MFLFSFLYIVGTNNHLGHEVVVPCSFIPKDFSILASSIRPFEIVKSVLKSSTALIPEILNFRYAFYSGSYAFYSGSYVTVIDSGTKAAATLSPAFLFYA